jgi:hypothetical protein
MAFAWVAVTVRFDELPATIELGIAVTVAVGAAGGSDVTVTVAVAEAVPPGPVTLAV